MRRTVIWFALAGILLALVIGTPLCWLRHAPALPPGFQAITIGMPLNEIESLLKASFEKPESCLDRSYYLIITRPECGQVTCINITTKRVVQVADSGLTSDPPRLQETCRSVAVYHWSRLSWLNESDWARTYLLGMTES